MALWWFFAPRLCLAVGLVVLVFVFSQVLFLHRLHQVLIVSLLPLCVVFHLWALLPFGLADLVCFVFVFVLVVSFFAVIIIVQFLLFLVFGLCVWHSQAVGDRPNNPQEWSC